jgi:hypothetical protein
LQPGSCAIYVCDANSGIFAAYGIQYNATAYKSATMSEAVIVPLDGGKAKPVLAGE